ncbi:unnamed protein product [Diatraea saccharalis]|uniref:Uncharacterized protein n=1 Tax=Diatraea saccharalis TaxID=40085 RepID=A0A9N9R454_9NEOP|nr:unnamed protein product [Diatraea saccharalis]
MLLQASRAADVIALIDGMKCKVRSILALWDPNAVEESLSYIGWPKNNCNQETDSQTMATIVRLTEQLGVFETMSSDCDTFDASSSSSSKETSPTVDLPTLTSSVPNMCPGDCGKNTKTNDNTGLHFHHDYFKSEREERSWHSFRSVRARPRLNETQSLSFESNKTRHGSLRYDNKCSASLEQVSYKCLMDNLTASDKRKNSVPRRESLTLSSIGHLDPAVRETNRAYLKTVGANIEETLAALVAVLTSYVEECRAITDDDLEVIKRHTDSVRRAADEASRWLRVSHAALRLRFEAPHFAREQAALQTRRDTCFSQALATVTTGLLCWLCSTPGDVIVKLLGSGLGPLCAFEGLLSLYSTEKAMWGDMVVAVEDLQTVVFALTKVGHSNSAIPQVTGTRGSLTVNIPISDSLYTKFASKEHLKFTITAVFFNVGINEKASLAEALGETTPQYHSNSDNLDRINKYCQKYGKVFPADHLAASRASSRTKPLQEVMENLRIAVHKKVPKNVEVLHLAALATRLMNGIRFTSCKSAKDRTGMSVTLEQCSILASEYHLAEHEMQKALNIMRSEGCRRENTLKNIGVRKYAFTKKQVASLPEDYRPPPGTYGSSHT